MKLNLGCGHRPILKEGWINVDIFKADHVDKAFNFNKFPYPFKDNTFEYIFCDCVLEHLDDPEKVMVELWRISKPNAILDFDVPYYNVMAAFNDVQHKNWFNENTFHVLIGESSSFSYTRDKFEIVREYYKKTRYFRLIPIKLLLKMSHYVPNLISNIKIKIKVIK